jgi:putative membrane protein
MVFGVLVWIGLVGMAGWLIGRHFVSPPDGPERRETPLEILERRYVRGEIGQDEFDEARARLREEHLHR